MKKLTRLLAFVLSAVIVLGLLPQTFANEPEPQTIPEGYIAVSTPEELWNIRENMAGSYILTADIDLTEALAEGGSLYNADSAWIPIGYEEYTSSKFTGILDGNGHKIDGLRCKGKYGGLIYENYGTIKNLTVASGTMEVSWSAGAFCVNNYGTIYGCRNYTSVSCVVTTGNGNYHGGGICANNYGTIESCANFGEVFKFVSAGGISGHASGATFQKVYNSGKISSATSTTAVQDGSYRYSAGGIAGAKEDGDAYRKTKIYDAYNAGDISGNRAGGAVGYMRISEYDGELCRFYNVGAISGMDFGGGIIGYVSDNVSAYDLHIYDCFYLDTMAVAINGAQSIGEDPVALSDEMMQAQSSFTDFDFETVWSMGTCDYKYPILQAFEEHTPVEVEAKAPTCTEDGFSAGVKCVGCGAVISGCEIIPALDHCYSMGTCTVCGEENTCSHDIEYGRLCAPTCTEAGYVGATFCLNCQEVFEEYVELDKTGHLYIDGVCTSCGKTAPESGNITWSYDEISKTLTISGYGNMDDYEAEFLCLSVDCFHTVAPLPSCEACVWNASERFLVLTYPDTPWKEFSEDIQCVVVGKDITRIGQNAFIGCPELSKLIIMNPECEIPPEQLNAYHGVYHDYVGVDTKIYGYENSTAEDYTQYVYWFQNAHNNFGAKCACDAPVVITNEFTTCTERSTSYASCSECADRLWITYWAVREHKYKAVVTAPTCTEGGYTTNTCTVCGDSNISDEVEALGHSYEAVVTAPTCTESGYTTNTCTVCGDSNISDEIEALGHSYEAIITATTCTTGGFTTNICALCGDSYISDEVAAPGHKYKAVMTNPTCTEAGSIACTCSVCADYYVSEIAPLGHNYETAVNEATCIEAGATVYTCANCADTYSEEIPALGHSYEAVVTDPTCAEAGCTTYTCACGDTYTEEIAALGHNYESVVTAPTCTEDGYTTNTCTVCNDSYVSDEVDALGHSYEAVVTAPTCTEGGFTTNTCTVCGERYISEPTDAVGHNYSADETDGIVTETCDNCGDTVSYPVNDMEDVKNGVEGNYYRVHGIVTWIDGRNVYIQNRTGAIVIRLNDNAKRSKIGDWVTAYGVFKIYFGLRVIENVDEKDPETYEIRASFHGKLTSQHVTMEELINDCDNEYLAEKVKLKDLSVVGVKKRRAAMSVDYTVSDGANTMDICDVAVESEADILPVGAVIEVEAIVTTNDGYQLRVADPSNITVLSVCEHLNTTTITAVAATCTEAGNTEGVKCSDCGKIISGCEAIEALGHSYEAVVTEPTCTQNGFTTNSCVVCGDSYVSDEIEAAHAFNYTVKGITHIVTCDNCDYSVREGHTFTDGLCICGREENPAPGIDNSLKFNMNISIGAEMVVNYNFPTGSVEKYADFYLEVRKDVAGGEPIVTTYGIGEGRTAIGVMNHPVTGAALLYNASYTGIAAKDMGDNFATTLYAVDADGNVYCGQTIVSSIKDFLISKIDDPDSIAELKTMAVDMLNYGAIAQLHFNYNTENLVTSTLTKEQESYATQNDAEAVNYYSVTGTGANVSTSITVGSKVEVSLSCINLTVNDPTNVKCVITDEEGKILATPDVSVMADVMFSAKYDNVGAREMRKVITATFYEGDKPISKVVKWSIESYVAQTRAKVDAPIQELALVNAMLIYGDSVASYLTASGL